MKIQHLHSYDDERGEHYWSDEPQMKVPVKPSPEETLNLNTFYMHNEYSMWFYTLKRDRKQEAIHGILISQNSLDMSQLIFTGDGYIEGGSNYQIDDDFYIDEEDFSKSLHICGIQDYRELIKCIFDFDYDNIQVDDSFRKILHKWV